MSPYVELWVQVALLPNILQHHPFQSFFKFHPSLTRSVHPFQVNHRLWGRDLHSLPCGLLSSFFTQSWMQGPPTFLSHLFVHAHFFSPLSFLAGRSLIYPCHSPESQEWPSECRGSCHRGCKYPSLAPSPHISTWLLVIYKYSQLQK